jgi:hypothetical protein
VISEAPSGSVGMTSTTRAKPDRGRSEVVRVLVTPEIRRTTSLTAPPRIKTFMRAVSEAEVVSMARESDCLVLGKEESEEIDAAVCLKQFPQGYILGISDKLEDLKLFFTPNRAEADKWYQHYRARLPEHGTPFGGP